MKRRLMIFSAAVAAGVPATVALAGNGAASRSSSPSDALAPQQVRGAATGSPVADAYAVFRRDALGTDATRGLTAETARKIGSREHAQYLYLATHNGQEELCIAGRSTDWGVGASSCSVAATAATQPPISILQRTTGAREALVIGAAPDGIEQATITTTAGETVTIDVVDNGFQAVVPGPPASGRLVRADGSTIELPKLG